jgi:hypothetical protein
VIHAILAVAAALVHPQPGSPLGVGVLNKPDGIDIVPANLVLPPR